MRQAEQRPDNKDDPIVFYQSEMDSMLPPSSHSAWRRPATQPYQGVGHISKDNPMLLLGHSKQSLHKEMPRSVIELLSLSMHTKRCSNSIISPGQL